MFSTKIKKQFKNHFVIPLRQYQLQESANKIIGITRYRSISSFIRYLKNEKIIKPYTLIAKNKKHITLYSSRTINKLTPYELAKAMFPEGYFCNLSSIYHHSLTNQVPNSIYICHETISANRNVYTEPISNNPIRGAFIKPHRYTNYVFDFNQHKIIVIDRVKNSDYGVVEIHSSKAIAPKNSRITCIERALIDAVVSPHYNGGISSVYAFFKNTHNAHKKLAITKLIDIYKKLGYIYPYSQSIGFLFDKAGMTKHASAIYAAFPPVSTFFVDHNAKTSWNYDEKWKLYYPVGLIDED